MPIYYYKLSAKANKDEDKKDNKGVGDLVNYEVACNDEEARLLIKVRVQHWGLAETHELTEFKRVTKTEDGFDTETREKQDSSGDTRNGEESELTNSDKPENENAPSEKKAK